MVEVARRIGSELIDVYLDFDERMLRMGFSDLAGRRVETADWCHGPPWLSARPWPSDCADCQQS